MPMLVRSTERRGQEVSAREIALRNAAAMDPNLLRRNWPKDGDARERYGMSESQYKHRALGLIEQLDACADDEARRILLGVSS
jgi:hypothetical protein